jgi:serine/threonine-protein kinase RIO1
MYITLGKHIQKIKNMYAKKLKRDLKNISTFYQDVILSLRKYDITYDIIYLKMKL